ncbi:MAG: TetR family transcriptional regulator, partial [Actinomycetota bacterium]
MNVDARSRIFAEARAAFAASGYDGASLRTITKAAGVDVALVAYYFGNKEGLFREVMASTCVRGDQMHEALENARHGAGAEVTRLLGEILESEPCRQVLEAIFRTVLSPKHDEDAMHRQVVEQLRTEYGNVIGGPDSHPGNHIFGALLTGTFVMRHLIPVEPLVSVDHDTLLRVLAVQAQEIIDAVDDRGEHAGWGELEGGVSGVVVDIGSDIHIGGATPGEDVTTKIRILDAARRSFARLGYHGTALRDLADEVGCNVALIPYHYGSKLGLFEAVVGQGLARTREIRVLMDERDPQ